MPEQEVTNSTVAIVLLIIILITAGIGYLIGGTVQDIRHTNPIHREFCILKLAGAITPIDSLYVYEGDNFCWETR